MTKPQNPNQNNTDELDTDTFSSGIASNSPNLEELEEVIDEVLELSLPEEYLMEENIVGTGGISLAGEDSSTIAQNFSELDNVAKTNVSNRNTITIDEETLKVINQIANDQKITPKLALKKSIALAVYIYQLVDKEKYKIYIQREGQLINELLIK